MIRISNAIQYAALLFCFMSFLDNPAYSQREPETMEWKETNLGTQVTHLNIISATFGNTSADHGNIYAVLNGEPGHFVVIDGTSLETIHDFAVEGCDGAYALLQASDGNIYFGSKPNGHLYRYKPGGDSLEDIGHVSEIGSYIWEMIEIPGGRLFMAMYPKAEVVEYNIAENTFKSWGPAEEGEEYCRSIAWSPKTQKLYCGVGAHAALIEWDLTTGAKQDILPEQYRDRHFVYTLDARAGKLIAKLDPVYDGFVLDLESEQVDCTLPGYHSQMASPLSPDGKSVYYSASRNLMRYDIEKKMHETVHRGLGGEAKAYLFDEQDGNPTLSILSSNAKLVKINLKSGESSLKDVHFPRQPGKLHSVACGPDGKIYTGGYLSGDIGVYDPTTGESIEYQGIDQPEGMTSVGNKIYFGVYTLARFYEWDVTEKWAPKLIGKLEDQGQDRPFAMLGAEDVEKVYFGTVPSYGLHGGAFGYYDIATEKMTVHRNIVPDQSIITICRAGDIVYAGSSYSGGLGIPPKAKEARLIGWDVQKNELVFSMAPVPGMRWISGLATGPHGNVWGWAEETLFVFNPETQKVVLTKVYNPRDINNEHVWRDYSMLNGGDGYMYGTVYGRFFRINAETKEMEDLATGPALNLLAQDRDGAFYYIEKSNLMKMEKNR